MATNVNRIPPRKFNLNQRVQVTIRDRRSGKSRVLSGKIIGYEDGSVLGRVLPRYPGWVYHVVLDVSDERVMVSEKNCQKC